MGKALSFASCPCGWPLWEEWANIIGGRFHYQPATLGGINYPDSGYRHDVKHTVEVVDPTHPITNGIPVSFEFTDELYLGSILKKMCTQYSDHVMTSLVSISTQQILRYVVKASVIKTGNIHPRVMQWGG